MSATFCESRCHREYLPAWVSSAKRQSGQAAASSRVGVIDSLGQVD